MSMLKPIDNGRMYPEYWRWNPIGGCEHGCSYCSIKRIERRAGKDMTTPVFRNGNNGTKNYLNDNLGSGRKIFVCSSGDMWGEWVESWWIGDTLFHCQKYPKNEYMFLTKYPARYKSWQRTLKDVNCILGATIETDEAYVAYDISPNAPSVEARLFSMWELRDRERINGTRTMISIEPIMTFSKDFIARLEAVNPDIIYIGADSGNNGLPEPSRNEIYALIEGLKEFTDVRLKSGLGRLLGVK